MIHSWATAVADSYGALLTALAEAVAELARERLRLAVCELRFALSNFDDVSVRIAYIASRLAVLILQFRDELGSATSPQLITLLGIRYADVHEATDPVGVGKDVKDYRRLSGVGPPPTFTISHVFAILMYAGAPLL